MHHSEKIIILSIIFLINISILHSQNSITQSNQKEHFDKVYFQSSALFRCLMKLPDKYNPENRYPLIVGLHGGNSTPEQFITIWDDIKEPQFIYAVPQAPYAWLMSGEFGYDWSLWPANNEKLIERAAIISENYIINLTKNLTKRYNVSDVYLLGFSQGAIFTYRVGIKNHDLIDGLVCLSGPGLLEKLWSPFSDTLQTNWLAEKYIKVGSHLRVFIANGEKDKFTPVELGIKSRDILIKYAYDVTFHTFDGGHVVNKEILKLVVKWLNNSK